MSINRRVEFEVIERRGEAISGEESREGRTFVIEESVGYLMNYASKHLLRGLSERLAAHDAHIGQWIVLLFLWAKDGRSQTELSRHAAIESATMVRTIDRMERDGFVQRVRDTRDRRRIHVHLTNEGRELRDSLVPCAIELNEEATKDFTEEERDQLEDYLRRIASNLEDDPEDRS